MSAVIKTAVSAIALAIASLGTAQAALLDLSAAIGQANVYSLTSFKAASGDVEGSIVAAGDVALKAYTTNLKDKDAFGQYALVTGGNLSYTGGDIMNGSTYVSGTTKLNGGATLASPVTGGTSPANFSMISSTMNRASSELSNITTTGTAAVKWSSINITGSNKKVEVIDLTADMLKSATGFSITGMAQDATLIVNVTGTSATLQGGYQAFDGYNVLFNFVDATQLKIQTGANISILAPKATVNGGSGVINGNVVIDSWNSQVQINSGNYFRAVNVPGLLNAVPEPETYAMMLAGLGMVGFISRRRKQKAAAR